MELNALCVKLGKKPNYKPIDSYPGMRPPNFNYNVRAPGPYQRSMQQWVQVTRNDRKTCYLFVYTFLLKRKITLFICPGTTIHFLQWDQWSTTWSFLLEVSSSLGRGVRGRWPNTKLLPRLWKCCRRNLYCSSVQWWVKQHETVPLSSSFRDSFYIFNIVCNRWTVNLRRRT